MGRRNAVGVTPSQKSGLWYIDRGAKLIPATFWVAWGSLRFHQTNVTPTCRSAFRLLLSLQQDKVDSAAFLTTRDSRCRLHSLS